MREYFGQLEPEERLIHLFKIKSDAEVTKVNDNAANNTAAFETKKLQNVIDDVVGDADETVEACVDVSSTEKKESQDSAAEMNFTKVALTKKTYMARDEKQTVRALKCKGKIICSIFTVTSIRFKLSYLINYTFSCLLVKVVSLPTHLFVSELHYIITDYEYIRLVTVLPDNSLVVCGKKLQGWKLTQYNQENGTEMFGRWFKNLGAGDGLAVVNLAGIQCLALSYG